METNNELNTEKNVSKEEVLSKRINSIGWALFFIMLGCLWMVPKETLPESTWLIGAGIIMLGTNLARYSSGIKMAGFNNVIGVLAVAAGISAIMGINLPVFPILVVIIGLSIILGHLTEKNDQRK